MSVLGDFVLVVVLVDNDHVTIQVFVIVIVYSI